jgi:hypothetical protein
MIEKYRLDVRVPIENANQLSATVSPMPDNSNENAHG